MSFRKKLQGYTEKWVQKGIINEGQKNSILADLEAESSASKLFRVLAIIGVLFVGAGIILIISSNWTYLPKVLKLILILLMPIISVGIGYYLSYVRSEYEKIGNALLFLGALLVGASLALLGQLYNLDGSVGRLLVWWLILTLPFTFIFKFRVFSVLTAVLLYSSMFYLLFLDTSRWWDEESIQTIVRTFTFVPLVVVILSEFLQKKVPTQFVGVFRTFEIVSLKVLFGALFVGLLFDGALALFGDTFGSIVVQNILFLLTVFIVMWVAIKQHNDPLRHSTFFWLGAYLIVKYFAWFWSYMDTGLFFVLFGIFLLGLVYGYIRFSRYIKETKEAYGKEILIEGTKKNINSKTNKHGE